MTPKVVIFDIEATNLDADFGYVLCFGWKDLSVDGNPVRAITIRDHPGSKATDDSQLMRAVYDVLSPADVIVTYYGKEFDSKFLATRMIRAGLPPLPPLGRSHVDLYYTVKNNFKFHSSRMGTVARYLGCPFRKTDLDGSIWVDAMAGDPEALQYVVHHCKQDVRILAWLYNRLKPYVRTHPNMARLLGRESGCLSCGSTRVQHRGRTVRGNSIVQRVWCPRCGRWDVIPIQDLEESGDA